MNPRLVLVVVLALSAGCSTLNPAGERATTVTPAPVPDATDTTTATSPLPPGVTGARIVDLDRLPLAHMEAVNGTAYTWESNYTRVRFFDDRLFVGDVRKAATVENQSHYTYWTNRKEAPREAQFSYLGEYELYADTSGRYTRLMQGGEFEYERLPTRPARKQIGQHAGSAITEYLQTENVSVAETRVAGQRYYEIVGTDYAFRTGYDIRNYTARALVSPDGFVRSLSVDYNQTRDGERERVTYTFEYSQVGTATVEKPAWVEDNWIGGGEVRLFVGNASANETG